MSRYQEILVETETQLSQLLDDITASKECAIDTETTGLHWALGDKAFMATFCPNLERGYALVERPDTSWAQTATGRILTAMEVNRFGFVFHNAVFLRSLNSIPQPLQRRYRIASVPYVLRTLRLFCPF